MEKISHWDYRFLELAMRIASWSKDPSTGVGAVLVRPDRTICATGYNGFPRKMRDDKKLYKNRTEKYSRTIHAEMNALIFAREPIDGYTIYTYPFLPCDRCAVTYIQANIARVVSYQPEKNIVQRWGEKLNRTRKYFNEAGVEFLEVGC